MEWKAYRSHTVGYFELAKILHKYRSSTGKNVKIHVPMRTKVSAVLAIVILVFALFYFLLSGKFHDFYMLGITIIGAFVLLLVYFLAMKVYLSSEE